MAEVSKGFVIGGFSEDIDFITGLAREVSEGSHAVVDEVEALTWAQANSQLDKVNTEAQRRIVFEHSAASLLVKQADTIVVFSGVEPTPLWKTAVGGIKVGTNSKIGHDEFVVKTGLSNGFKEVGKHPSTLQIPFRAQKFSTVQMLKERGEQAFPGGRYYLPAQDDEFGFGGAAEIQEAHSDGMVARFVGRWHNHSMLHPRDTAATVEQLFEDNN